MKPLLFAISLVCLVPALARGDDPVYSGPQVGEALPGFKVRGVFEKDAGQELDFVAQADGKPLVLIFVHNVNRQSIGMVRVLSGYTHSRLKDLATGIVWLQDDVTEAENTLKRIQHALTPGAPTGISVDGREGPGAYGLNRNVMLTILVGKDGVVKANYALVQPSLQVDLPKILESIVAVAGGTAPRLQDLEGMAGRMRAADAGAPNLRPLLAPLIRRDATPEEVQRAARAVETAADADPATRREVGRIASTIVNAGKLKDYGTPQAQEYLAKWAKSYGPEGRPANPDRTTPPAETPAPAEPRP